MFRVMIADESSVVRKVGMAILADIGFGVIEAESALDALAKCEADRPDILIVDAALHGALELIANVRLLPGGTRIKIYYCIVGADLKTLMAGKHAGADEYLLKPFDRKVLTSVFAHLLMAA